MAVFDTVNRKADITSFGIIEDRLFVATRAWVLWLQGLFSTRSAGQYKWSINDTETEILIHDHNPTNTEKTNKRPFITTQRGAAILQGVSRDQTLSRTFAGDDIKFSDIMRLNMNITCVAREGIEAQDLAYLIFRMIPVFETSIIKVGRLHWIGNNIQILPETSHGAIVPGSSYPEWRAVQIVVPFAIQDVISAKKGFYNVLRTVNLHMGIT
jgi:hypothetical protein